MSEDYKAEILTRLDEVDTRLDALNTRLLEVSSYLNTLDHLVRDIRKEMELNK